MSGNVILTLTILKRAKCHHTETLNKKQFYNCKFPVYKFYSERQFESWQVSARNKSVIEITK